MPLCRCSDAPLKAFRCPYSPECSAAFSKKIRLTWHLKVHDGDRPYKCSVADCSKSFTRPYHLTRHTQKSHGSNFELPSKFVCKFPDCGKALCTHRLLERHMKRVHEGPQFSCLLCSSKFRRKRELKLHEVVHTNVLPYPCAFDGCCKSFLTANHLTRHEKTHDGHVCPVEGCEAKFETWSLLRKHKSVKHRKLHACSHCQKSFVRKASLDAHVETHAEERECVQCVDCDAILVCEKSFKNHSLRCPAKKERLICDFVGCEKVFLSKHNFLKHKQLHESCPKFRLKFPSVL